MQSPHPDEAFATLSGLIEAKHVEKAFQTFPLGIASGIKRVHLALHSPGGCVSDAIAIHNYLVGLPVEIITYNVGSVSSMAVPVYLAGKRRIASSMSTFMLHMTVFQGVANANELRRKIDMIEMNDRLLMDFLTPRIKMAPENWEKMRAGDFMFPASDAVSFGLATEVGEFSVPQGAQLYDWR
jgi:ATP-dependent Clp protease, protease subunit